MDEQEIKRRNCAAGVSGGLKVKTFYSTKNCQKGLTVASNNSEKLCSFHRDDRTLSEDKKMLHPWVKHIINGGFYQTV